MSLKNKYDCIVIGAGIVGLTVAYEYQNNFPDQKLLILEKDAALLALILLKYGS